MYCVTRIGQFGLDGIGWVGLKGVDVVCPQGEVHKVVGVGSGCWCACGGSW